MSFFKAFCLIGILLLGATTASAQITITRPNVAGPIRLVCLNPDGLRDHVRTLTRNQIIGVRYAARDGEIGWPCDDVQLPVGTVLLHERWLQTEDRWWVLGQTVQYPNGSMMVTVDPLQALYGSRPIQFKRYYGWDGDYFVPMVPQRHTTPRYSQRPLREKLRDLTIKEGQQLLRQQLGLPPLQ